MKKGKFINYFNILIIFVFITFFIISISIINVTLNTFQNTEREKQKKLIELIEYSIENLVDRWIKIINVDLYTSPKYLSLKIYPIDFIKKAYVFDSSYKIKEIIKQDIDEPLDIGFSVKYYQQFCENMVLGEYRIIPFSFSPLTSKPELSAVLKYDKDTYYIFIYNTDTIKEEIIKFIPEKSYVVFTINKNVVFLNTSSYPLKIVRGIEDLNSYFGNKSIITSRNLQMFSGKIYFITPYEKFADDLKYLEFPFKIVLLALFFIFIFIYMIEKNFINEMLRVVHWGSEWKPGSEIKDIPTAFYENENIKDSIKSLMNNINNTLNSLKKTQNELIQSQKMEIIGIMAGGFAHDFNNILTVLKTEVELMKYAESKEEIDESIENIEVAIKRATNIIKQMLVFSKKSKLHFEIFNLKNFMDNTYKLLRKGIPLNISLELKNNVSDDINIYGNSNQITQVLLNLVANSRDAVVNVEKPKIEITIDQFIIEKNEYVRITIADNGMGMNKETLDKIFEPFYTTKGKQGTGLGLAIVSKIISDHGGFIEVSSEMHKGTSFHIYLPISRDKIVKDQEFHIEEVVTLEDKYILLVDDEDSIRNNLKKQFEKLKAYVYPATSVKEGKVIFKNEKRINAVITDYMMPEETGEKLVEYIRNMDKDIKIIVITGYLSNDVRIKLEKYNVDIVTKPFEFSDLLKKLIDKFKAG